MKKYFLLIEVFDKEKMIDSFYYDLNNIHPLKLPDKLPYQGLEFYIKGSIENVLLIY